MAEVIKVDKVVDAHEGDLRVWWISNVPGPAEFFVVESREKAQEALGMLAQKDMRDPTVESNAGGLEVFEDGDWTEWYDEDGNDIDHYL